jgi:hypothetical protein
MTSNKAKESYLNYSPKTLLLVIFGVLAPISGTIYIGITTYNRVIAATEAIESSKPYDDAELKAEVNALKVQLYR